MKKMWMTVTALALAAALCLTGCGTAANELPADDTVADAVISDEVVADDAMDTLGFTMTKTIANRDDFLEFMAKYDIGMPASYETVVSQYGTDVNYSLNYDGTTCTLFGSVVINGELQTIQANVVDFQVRPLYTACGEDMQLYLYQLSAMDLFWAAQQSLIDTVNGICQVYAVTDQQQMIAFEYYYNEDVQYYVLEQ